MPSVYAVSVLVSSNGVGSRLDLIGTILDGLEFAETTWAFGFKTRPRLSNEIVSTGSRAPRFQITKASTFIFVVLQSTHGKLAW